MNRRIKEKSDRLVSSQTQPDQNNPKMKIKYFTDDNSRIPLHRDSRGQSQTNIIYNADGSKTTTTTKSKQHLEQSEFTKNTFPKLIEDDEFDEYFNSTFFGNNVSNGTSKKDKCCSKSKYIHAPYEPTPNLSSGGYGENLDLFAENKFGQNTRDNNESISGDNIDRFHFTFRNYQNSNIGSFPDPENTRLTNKKTLNNNY